jgi:hypothetical protein
MRVKFNEWDCIVMIKQYPNKRTAIQLVDAEDGCPVAMATVNVPAESIEKDEVIIKDYSENSGILAALVGEGVVSKPLRTIRTGFVEVYVCKLLRNSDGLTQEDLQNECDLNGLENQVYEG